MWHDKMIIYTQDEPLGMPLISIIRFELIQE